MPLHILHAGLANTALLYSLALGLWALWRALRRQALDGNYWGALVIGEALILIQGGIGLMLWAGGGQPARGAMHMLYGAVALLTFPGVFAYTRGENSPHSARLYGIAGLFLAAILLRAAVTGA